MLCSAPRLDIQHYAIQQATQKRYHVPLDNPKRALDVGAGTGVWIMEMASDFPECEFSGVDIAPLQPTTVLPKNCEFKLANLLEGLPYPDSYFDYVRHCMLVAAIPKDHWLPYIEECARLCAPGGWIEMGEFNGRVYEGGPACDRLGDLMQGGLRKRGLSPETTEVLDDLMRQAGLVDVQAWQFKLPMGSWGGSSGMLLLKDMRMIQNALAPMFMSVCGMSQEDVEQQIKQSEEELETHKAYTILRVYIGRKP
ncbi:S-adenosyl-L-methionine-dependent methyltransferase [Thamnocephalis sphaerospora]|uniref:S-adenosyl-L-methionine-dependent methyltransferase n=1 Tax=Thamnocephalis sphaerospora TaxID=78915 RepID=A0A4P9XGF9_9FUNG|nr:S-adenosyl-L-methionine-dependent methyltransferase [Thamnocephalis sphaerospora]|eukprot:RKP04668.1 S-adenosyl-L-methionine-dependent methyltransferase [Thamnocephalis sphaerospora]